ncbi:MAG: amidoligase family protein [Clostridia bacterium]|nr:amidoligase family protein [Clostridia bacterium]
MTELEMEVEKLKNSTLKSGFMGARPAKITNEQIEKYQDLGRQSLSDLLLDWKNNPVPYSQQETCFTILAKLVREDPERVNGDVVYEMLNHFSSAYFQKEVMLMARDCPEQFKSSFGQFIQKANSGTITDARDLIKISKNVLGEEFFKDEEIIDKFNGKYRTSIIKSLHEELSDESFKPFLDGYLEEANPDSIVHLISGTTFKNNLGLSDYLPELMERADIRDRKTIFEIALIAENTKEEDLARCIKQLRREDLTNVIYEMLNKEVNLETVFMLGYSPDELEEYQRTLASRIDLRTKAKLAGALKGLSDEIFPDSDDKKLKLLNSKHYQVDYAKLEEVVKGYEDKALVKEDRELLEYNLENLVQIISGDDKPLKHKQLQNIMEHEELIKNQIGKRRLDLEGPIVVNDYFVPKVSRDTSFKGLISHLEEDMVSEFYESIGIDNKELSVNEAMKGKQIRYGVEIEEVGVADNDYMSDEEYLTLGFRTTTECSIRNYRKDYEQSIPFTSDNSGSEFVSDVMHADSKFDLQKIDEQMKTLKEGRAKTNFSCGMHIHVSSPETIEDKKDIARKMTKEFKYIQDAVIDNFEVYPSRLSTHCKKLQAYEPEWFDRFRTVNMASLDRHGTIEFRFFNLPDSLDMKVLESYIDFATCYYTYVEGDEHFKGTCTDFIKDNAD